MVQIEIGGVVGATPYKVREVTSQSIEMMLNSRNNAFYGIFMPLHHSLGFPNIILEGGSFDPHDPPGSAPEFGYLFQL